eukprot:192479_1
MNDRGGKKVPMDPLQLTKQRITLALIGNTKPDKWDKMMQQTEVHDSIDKFCNTKEIKLLIITWDNSGNLISYNSMPRNSTNVNSFKKKSMAFFKTQCAALNPRNYNEYIFNIEYTSNPLENLSVLSRGVFLPLLKNENNRDQWSAAASQKILFEFNQFISDLYVIVGESQAKTLLPLPPSQIYDISVDTQQQLNMLEQFLNGWTKQIKTAITKDPIILFKNGGNPDPLDELKFWSEKAQDLKQIQQQLDSEKVQQLLNCFGSQFEKELERNQILLLQEFNTLCIQLNNKLYESSSNVCFLKSLEKK